MKQIKKIFALLFTVIIITSSQTVFATDIPTQTIPNSVAEYSLLSNETQTFSLTDENNKPYYITIEPEFSKTRMKNGNYKITHTVPDSWTASFIVNISSNQIISVSSPSVLALTGYITDINLRKNSSTQATLTFLFHYLMYPLSTGITAYISNNTLLVKKL